MFPRHSAFSARLYPSFPCLTTPLTRGSHDCCTILIDFKVKRKGAFKWATLLGPEPNGIKKTTKVAHCAFCLTVFQTKGYFTRIVSPQSMTSLSEIQWADAGELRRLPSSFFDRDRTLTFLPGCEKSEAREEGQCLFCPGPVCYHPILCVGTRPEFLMWIARQQTRHCVSSHSHGAEAQRPVPSEEAYQRPT